MQRNQATACCTSLLKVWRQLCCYATLRPELQPAPCQPWPKALQEAESDAAASQVQVAALQRQLTAARCTSLLELRQQVLGGAGAGTSAPELAPTSSEDFSFRPSGTASEVSTAVYDLAKEGT